MSKTTRKFVLKAIVKDCNIEFIKGAGAGVIGSFTLVMENPKKGPLGDAQVAKMLVEYEQALIDKVLYIQTKELL